VDWLLAPFGKRHATARKKYMRFVREGLNAPVPWDKSQGQIYLGGEDFIKKHQPNRPIKELPYEQTQAYPPELKMLFEKTESIGCPRSQNI